MKKLSALLVAVFAISLSFQSCVKESFLAEEQRIVTLTFENGKDLIEIETVFIGKPAILVSEEGHIRKLDATLETGQPVIGYVLSEKAYADLNIPRAKWRIYRGYGFTGECFQYGTFFEDDEGSTLFVPDNGYSGPGFQPICPSYDEAFAQVGTFSLHATEHLTRDIG